MNDLTYDFAVANATHLKAIGQTDIYLINDPYPWSHVTECKPGGSHRLEISTTARFTAVDPTTGLRFSWSFDIEPRSANGKGQYEIDTNACRAVVKELGGEGRKQFLAYLADCATKVKSKAEEWKGYADRQFADAATLEALSTLTQP